MRAKYHQTLIVHDQCIHDRYECHREYRRPNIADHSALMLAARITLPHFSVSSVMSVLKSAGEPPRIMPPRSASCVFILGSTRPALTSLLSLSIIPAGVPAGAPKPKYPLDS